MGKKTTKKPTVNRYKGAAAKETPLQYRSKVDWWFYGLFGLITVFSLAFFYDHFFNHNNTLFIGAVFLFADLFILLPMLVNTRYTLTRSSLKVKSGFFCNVEIFYSQVLSFEETRSLFSAAALSSQRLKITYTQNGREQRMVISPAEKQDFLREFKERLGW
ncbi:MAG: PH domain-containing protein [Bacillota bacterium]|nr:PH domain-containing protein [Bacillota bacterium]